MARNKRQSPICELNPKPSTNKRGINHNLKALNQEQRATQAQ